MRYEFRIFSTYVDDDVNHYTIEMNEEDVKDEKKFLHTLFRAEERMLKYIVGYSVTQVCKNIDEMLPFLIEGKGRYYFTDQYPEMLSMRNEYLEYLETKYLETK